MTKPTFRKILEPLLLIGFISLFVFLASFNLNRGYWKDELISLNTLSVSSFTNPFFVGVTTNLPLFFTVLKVWNIFVSSENPIAFRLLPVLLSVSTLALWWFFLKKTFGLAFSVVFALLFVTTPIQTYYATEIRPYALTQLLLSAQFISLLYLLKRYSMKAFTIFGVLTVLALLTHYSVYFFVFAECVLLIVLVGSKFVRKEKAKRELLLAIFASVVTLVVGILGYLMLSKSTLFFDSVMSLSTSRNTSTTVVIDDINKLKEVFTFYYWYGLYYYYVDLPVQFVFKKLIFILIVASVGLLVIKRKDTNLQSLRYLSLTLVISLIATIILENFGLYPFGGRHIMPYAAFYYVTISWPIYYLAQKTRWILILPLLLAVLFGVFNLNLNCAGNLGASGEIVRIYEECAFK